jgi:hypothetical protein
MDNNETVEYIFRNSGKDYNDLGRFEDCYNNSDFHYILATIPLALPIPMSVGLCVPAVCSVDDFMALRPTLVPLLDSLLPELFEGVKGFDHLQLTLRESDLLFVDSRKRNAEVTHADAMSWITAILIVLFTLAVLVSSLSRWYFIKKAAENHKKTKKAAKKNAKKGKKSKSSREEGVFAKNGINHDEDEDVEALDESFNRKSRRQRKRSKKQ